MPEIVLLTDNLTKRYGSLTAVNRLSLEVHDGEVFGFLRPNGAGLGNIAFELGALLILSILYFAAGIWLFQRMHLNT